MPRPYKYYSDASLTKAAGVVRKGWSLRKAEKHFNVPKSSICEEIITHLTNNSKEKAKKVTKKRGRKTKKKPELEQPNSEESEVEHEEVARKRKKNVKKQRDDYDETSDEDSFEVPLVDTDDDADLFSEESEEVDEVQTPLPPDAPPATTVPVPESPQMTIAQEGQDNMPSTSGTSPLRIPKVDDFVVVNYVYDKGKKRENVKVYMGKVVHAAPEGDRFTVLFMRNYKGDPNIYHFPEIDDEDEIDLEDIQRIARPVCLRRDRYTFLLD